MIFMYLVYFRYNAILIFDLSYSKTIFVPYKYWSEYANIHINYNYNYTLQMFKVNKIFFLNKLILPFSKDALNWFTKWQ